MKDGFEELPIIVVRRLEGNDPTSLNALQEFLVPHLGVISLAWWGVWFLTLGYLCYVYLITPFLTSSIKNNANKEHNSI
jgi:hypothetical protein